VKRCVVSHQSAHVPCDATAESNDTQASVHMSSSLTGENGQPGLARAGMCFLALVLVCGASRSRATEFMAGADISALSELEDNGAVYKDNGQQGDAIDIFRDHGVNWFRLRLFVNPTGNGVVVNDLDYTIALAQRVKASGAKLLLDFHYSDTWADPGQQTKPSAWTSLNFSQLQTRVHDYTSDAISAMSDAGVLPDMVQVGNEIANGMLWDDGRLWRPGVPESTEFNNLAALVSAGINGVKDGAGAGNEPLIMLHHDQGANWGTTSYYLDRLLPRLQANGTDVDVIGYSYYPKFHYDPNTGNGDMNDVQTNLDNTVSTYGKPVAIVETAFPSSGAQYEPDYEFDVSEAGQEQFLQSLVNTVQNVPNGQGLGVFWWYPEAVPLNQPVNGEWVYEGGRYGLFDQNHNAVTALSVFDQFLPTGIPGDYNGDGVVNAADYTVWRDHFESDPNFDLPNEDATEGSVTEDDFYVWRSHFGEGAGGGDSSFATAAVPEPDAGLLFLMSLAGSMLLRIPTRSTPR
jgi:arabinogalactan endo-1,4-beta-galactosidase